MKVLSLFDGISCARVALERCGFQMDKYYASEIDKYAIKVAQKNYPDTIQLGDVKNITKEMVGDIDLLIGGSPCQDLSIAKRGREGLGGSRSGLFWEYVRILKEINPKYFVLENVNSMPKEAKLTITETLGVEPIMINAALVSAQNRKRLFWTNIPNVTLPQDRGILLKDILEENVDDKYFINNYKTNWNSDKPIDGSRDKYKTLRSDSRGSKTGLYLINEYNKRIMTEKCGTLGTTMSRTAKQGYLVIDTENLQIRKLTPIECERLQSLPDNYTEGLSNTQRYKCLGNAFNTEVVRHILSFIK